MRRSLALALLAPPLICAAQSLPASAVLVAKPEFLDPTYGQTVLVVRSIGEDRHIGFIVNKPSTVTLGRILPDNQASAKVESVVYMGGPFAVRGLFVLLARAESPGEGAVQMMPGLYAVLQDRAVNRIIDANPGDARYLLGMVTWRAGELRAEIGRGAWYVLEADPAIVFRDADGLWEALARERESPASSLR